MICVWILNIGSPSFLLRNNRISLYNIFVVAFLRVMVSTYCYIKIYLKLLHHQAQIQEHVHHEQPNGHEPLNIARYRKTVASSLWVDFLLQACYLPMGIVTVLRQAEK